MKTAHRIAAVALACLAAPHALAQRVAPVVERYEPQDWTLHAEVFLDAYPPRGQGGVRYARSYEIQSAAVVFPLLEESASHETHIDRLRSQLVFEDRVMDDQPTLLDDYQSGERLGRWDLPKVRGSNLRLQLDLPMRAWKIRFNEQRAMSIPWPQNELGPIPASALRSQAYVEADDPDVVALVRRWTRGNPRAVPPAMLAKALAGEVINHFQPNGQGYEFGRNGRFEGFEIRGAAYAARRGRGTPYDMIALLAAAYRVAGLPARVVIGYDVRESLGDAAEIFDDPACVDFDPNPDGSVNPILHAWVEFYLIDETTGEEWWVPVDVLKQRMSSSKPPPLDREWAYFGSNPCFNNILPISFHFHPPTTVVAAGSPAMWGWLPVPDIPVTEQWMLYSANHTPIRAGEQPR